MLEKKLKINEREVKYITERQKYFFE